jgi:hypothetical protein
LRRNRRHPRFTLKAVAREILHLEMLRIRPAAIHDAALLRTMIRELAEFEHALDFVTITAEELVRDGFEKAPRFRAFIAEWEGHAAGYALFVGYYSTWQERDCFWRISS